MRKIHGWVISLSLGLCLLLSCKKGFVEEVQNTKEQQVNSYSVSASPRLSYGDSIFFLKNQPGNYTILPVSKPSAAGYFKANPLGLELDSLTGHINVTKSETGLRYKVYYLDNSGNPLDSVKIVISGIDYTDSIYRIQLTPNAYDTAFPVYNALPGLALPCGDDDGDIDDGDIDDDDIDDDDIDDDDNQCVFDETDLDDDGNDDIPGVIQDKLMIDIKKGTIDAEASFHAGVFGSSNPANGVTKDFTFYYRIADASNRALNKITVRLYHYNTVNDIPQWLLDEISNRKNTSLEVNSWVSNNAGTVNNQSGTTANRMALIEYRVKRPPIIVIVSQ